MGGATEGEVPWSHWSSKRRGGLRNRSDGALAIPGGQDGRRGASREGAKRDAEGPGATAGKRGKGR